MLMEPLCRSNVRCADDTVDVFVERYQYDRPVPTVIHRLLAIIYGALQLQSNGLQNGGKRRKRPVGFHGSTTVTGCREGMRGVLLRCERRRLVSAPESGFLRA